MKSFVLIFSWCVMINAGILVGILDNPVAEIVSDANKAALLAVTHEEKETAPKSDLDASVHHLITLVKSTLGSLTGAVESIPLVVKEIIRGAVKGASGEDNVFSSAAGLLSGTVAGVQNGLIEGVAKSLADGLSGADKEDEAEIYRLVYSALSEALESESAGQYDAAALLTNVDHLLEHTLGVAISQPEDVIGMAVGAVEGLLKGVEGGLKHDNLIKAVTGGVRGATDGLTEFDFVGLSNTLKNTLLAK